MTELPAAVVASGAFEPTAEDIASVEAWFAEYDGHATNADVERMADMAMFPLNVVSDSDESGDGGAAQQTRQQFVEGMSQVMGEPGEVKMKMESRRTPIFLTRQLVLVISDATFTTLGMSQRVRYADVLVKRDGKWFFQTMVQGGWGDQLAG
ncbi:nuclear transport factor 2 family protein [Kibdelosporangium philippinense]|uniref:Nuclear transport factor 2 family protein n=1 Tax=Kibdelosporangium philippinense TaxID=211113 RepID=A0ABS8ZGK4_9PSEU|nr:nuclear transport factor 2 family protein [Kibdelosporangium philippinense]MCE7006577.1 nuclear transport factor 2 family protein [Kibdelosporangium philippinense]